ncbi:MAG: hypothetical protein ACK2VD_23230 [Anaerolineae bacterium]|jgi:hypothetical protein
MSEDAEEPAAFLHPIEIGDLFYAGPAIRAWIVGCEDEARLQPVEVMVECSAQRARGTSATHARPETHTRIDRRPR